MAIVGTAASWGLAGRPCCGTGCIGAFPGFCSREEKDCATAGSWKWVTMSQFYESSACEGGAGAGAAGERMRAMPVPWGDDRPGNGGRLWSGGYWPGRVAPRPGAVGPGPAGHEVARYGVGRHRLLRPGWWRRGAGRRGVASGAALALVATACAAAQMVSPSPASAAATEPAPAGWWNFDEGSAPPRPGNTGP